MRRRPKNAARDSATMVPFDCVNEECGRDVVADGEGAGMTKAGNELEEGRGIGVKDVWLGGDTCQRHL